MRGTPTRRTFGVRTWLALETIELLLHLVHPTPRTHIHQALTTAITPPAYRVPGPVQPTGKPSPPELAAQIRAVRALCDDRDRAAATSVSRTFDGEPFPAILTTAEVRALLP